MDDTVKPSTYPIGSANDREISLGEMCAILWRSRWFLIVFSAVAGALAFGISMVLPVKYNAVIIVSPVSGENGSSKLGALSDVASSLGGLGSLLGMGAPGNDQKAESIATLQSELLTETYMKENNLLPILYAKDWDAASKTWKIADPKKRPTLWKANAMFAKKIRGLTENSKTGLVTLTISWRDPVQAAAWANGLVKLANDYLRQKSITHSERNIQYLDSQAAKTNEIELRSAIFELMQTEIKNEMLSRGNDEYALKIIDPAAVPEKPASPQPVLLTISAAIAGLIIGGMIALIRSRPG